MNADDIIIGMYEVMEDAVNDGDWKIDGSCDPSYIMDAAEVYLKDRGYFRNSIDGAWCK